MDVFDRKIMPPQLKDKYNYFNNYDFNKHPQILAVCIFGSKVSGKDHRKSDIDVALIVNKDFKPVKDYDLPLIISSRLESISGKRVDIVIFNNMDPLFKTEIRVKGKLIYVKDRERFKKVFFKARKEFEDYLVRHKYYLQALKKRYISHG